MKTQKDGRSPKKKPAANPAGRLRAKNGGTKKSLTSKKTGKRTGIRKAAHGKNRAQETAGRNRAETGLKEAVDAVLKQSRIAESFFSHTLSLAALLDRDFNFIRVNEAYAKADGRDVSEFPGHNHFEFYPSDAKEIFERVVEEKKPYQIFAKPFTYPRHPERGITYWDWALVPVLDGSGEVEILIFVLHDVTEHKRVEKALELKNSVFDASIAANSIADINGILTEVNDAFLKQWGYDNKDEVIGKPIPFFLARDEEATAILGSLSARGVWEGDYTARKKDGSTYFAHGTATTLWDENGNPTGYQSSVIDVTERRQAEEKARHLNQELEQRVAERTVQLKKVNESLKEEVGERKRAQDALHLSNQRVIDILESIQDGFLTLDRDWRITYINQRAAQNVGFAPEELIGESMWEKFPEILGTEHEAHYRRVMEERTPLDFEITGVLTPGTYNIRVYPTPEGISIYWLDISERKRSEEEIKRLNQDLQAHALELEAANKELEAFAYSVSHDLRAPLRHVAGYVELLLKNAPSLDEKNQHYLQVVSASANRMGILIDELLNFSRMGRAEIRKTLVHMEELARETINDLRMETAGRDIVWEIAPLPPVYGDRSMLKLVFTNLIANAVKFTKPQAQARIAVGFLPHPSTPLVPAGHSPRPAKAGWGETEGGGEVTYFVRDNGVGFDMQYADKLFGLFQRLHHADEFEGTGVGLANVRRIIHRHGGRIWAQAAVNEGAAFYFSLPRDPLRLEKNDDDAG
ncbi:MAG: hypothetical protein DPW18_00610 [Chloroflexi bacterium]|nr:hypothetical protein [Chloroflexota bacterium]MDL1941310.1 PAS domain S-box protein [Chloroflexi bacterium CFX2]